MSFNSPSLIWISFHCFCQFIQYRVSIRQKLIFIEFEIGISFKNNGNSISFCTPNSIYLCACRCIRAIILIIRYAITI